MLMTIPASGQGPPSGEDMSGLFAEFEAAGCVGEDITDPFQCYRDAIDSGLIKDPAGAGGPAAPPRRVRSTSRPVPVQAKKSSEFVYSHTGSPHVAMWGATAFRVT